MGARHELFYDTEAALRLVDGEVRAMTGAVEAPAPLAFERASVELRAVLANVRDSRAVLEALDAVDHATSSDARGAACESLAHAARVLADVEARVLSAAELFGASGVGRAAAGDAVKSVGR